jgi:hypothetical protein
MSVHGTKLTWQSEAAKSAIEAKPDVICSTCVLPLLTLSGHRLANIVYAQ